MNRITALLASLAVAFGLAVTIAPAAQADGPTREQIGACLGQLKAGHLEDECAPVIWTHLAGINDARVADVETIDWLTFKLTVKDAQIATTEAQLTATQHSLDLATAAYERMADRFAFQRELALARRATIIELRHELRDRV